MMATRSVRRRRAAWPLALVLAAGLLVVVGRPSSADVDLGTVNFAPDTGTASQANLNLTTSSIASPAGCPDGSSQASVTITGPGAWSAGISFDPFRALVAGSELTIPLSPTIASAGALAGADIVAGKYVVTVTCLDRLGANSFGTFTGALWFTDATTWQDTDPDTTTTLTQVTLKDNPAGRVDEGGILTLTASLTPATATGTVQFFDRLSDSKVAIGAPIPVSGGRAVLATSGLAFGLHYLSVSFVPDDPNRYGPATSAAPDLNFVVAHPQPTGSGG
jgi:Bacterial Ig-like domain (group 3)